MRDSEILLLPTPQGEGVVGRFWVAVARQICDQSPLFGHHHPILDHRCHRHTPQIRKKEEVSDLPWCYPPQLPQAEVISGVDGDHLDSDDGLKTRSKGPPTP